MDCSIIIPTFNTSDLTMACMKNLRQKPPHVSHEIIVVDGGSADETCAIAQKSGATVIHSRPGRARQMNAGAARAAGNVLLFLHGRPDFYDQRLAMLVDQLGTVRA